MALEAGPEKNKRSIFVMSSKESRLAETRRFAAAKLAELQRHETAEAAVSQRQETAEIAVPQRSERAEKVRPYVRSSTHKLRWTQELHQSFMDAVNLLGGKERATPKRILSHMKRDDLTIAQVKSHLQMLRLDKVNTEGMPAVNAEDPVVLKPIVSKELNPTGPRALDLCEPLSMKEQREVFTALQLLKEGEFNGPDGAQKLLQGLSDFDRFSSLASNSDKDDTTMYREFIIAADDNLDSLSGRKREAEDDIALDLSIASCVRSPKSNSRFRFPTPDNTADEPTLNLGLALAGL